MILTNPFALLAILHLIGRYLKASGDPGCERAGEQMEQDVEDLLSGAWRIVEGCVLGGLLAACALGVIVAIIGWIGRLFGL